MGLMTRTLKTSGTVRTTRRRAAARSVAKKTATAKKSVTVKKPAPARKKTAPKGGVSKSIGRFVVRGKAAPARKRPAVEIDYESIRREGIERFAKTLAALAD